MAQIKTTNFLPEIYRTTANEKFLNATLDQLVTQPDLRNINGYVGRKFAPTFKSTDNYIPEPNGTRQNYQLEPSVVVRNKINNKLEFFSSYIDLLQQVKHSGGFADNQSRLFSGESYSYDGLFDFDKFVNFNQYYWLENGPQPVLVYASGVPTKETFIVTRDARTGTYKFSTTAGVENPTIKLGYGGTYEFVVNQPGYPFWIQSAPGTSGLQIAQTGLSSRDILGVTNNGADVGTITFNVPQPTAQDFYVNMTLAGSVDLSTTLSYTQVQGQRLSSIVAAGENGFDGVYSTNQINLKTLIFVNSDLDSSKWTVDGVTVPVAVRRNAWRISLSTTNGIVDADPIVTLNPLTQAFAITALQKVFVIGGLARAEFTYYLASDYLLLNQFKVMPNITATLTTLYYQDNSNATMAGEIDILAVDAGTIDVVSDILTVGTYISPNGVEFTNGMVVTFDTTAIPTEYQGNSYYVEGVGSLINLVNVNNLISPESFAANGLTTPDYITINRASMDLNPWTRSNRWVHVDVINAAATYNNTTAILDQTLRANRPIIEFEPNIQLFNYGRIAKAPVDLINFNITDSRNSVELQLAGYQLDGVTLTDGMRVIFANDYDPTVRDLIYVVNIVEIRNSLNLLQYRINLTPAQDSSIAINNSIIVNSGPYQGIQFYYNGSSWIQAQQKSGLNQSPLFDVIDTNNVSLGDSSVYNTTTSATAIVKGLTYRINSVGTTDFTLFGAVANTVGNQFTATASATDSAGTGTVSTWLGTPIFSYTVGTGSNDTVLGFPLSYRTFNQIGDIQFTNNFDSDSITYTDSTGNSITADINSLGWLQQNQDLTNFIIRNSWTTNTEQSKQFQIISGVYDGNNPYFKIDISADGDTTVPYFRVYRNSVETTGYNIVTVGVLQYVHIVDTNLTTGDQIDIAIYNNSTVSQLGYYQVPLNLDYNSQNKNFKSLTLGQLRNHVSTMVENSNQITGNFPGSSNLRDKSVKQQGGSILQHASPVLYSELFLVDPDTNFLSALDLARREYSKLKNKIIELSMRTPNLDFTNIPSLLDTLLKTINSAKNKSFAWYYSDMVPYGDIKNTITYNVLSSEVIDYELSSVFDVTTLSNVAVLVYLNGVQLIKDTEYVFDTTKAGVTIKVPLVYGDIITVYEYSNTDGCYIPETPTKLGLYPKFTPMKYYDTTYSNPIYVIQGHDGSITPAFGDFRDDLLLEFEKRVYNNIKVNPDNTNLNLFDYIPGKFRTTDYNFKEFTQLLTDSFLMWAGNNKVDYITNTSFVSSNPFSWCYNKFNDSVSGEQLSGYWRAIYKYFYDTDRPHTNPWEMLGFSQEPSWWESRYGTAPFTGGNMVLWNDLASGFVWNNGSSYYDKRFIRPGLQNIIPVDATGALVPPNQILVKSLNSAQVSSNFKIGDQGPVETAWRRSSDYPFAVQQALALAKPAFYFGTLINVNEYYKNTQLNQFIFTETLQRISPYDIDINGVVDLDEEEPSISRSAGYINWVADYLRNQGIDPGVKIGEYFNDLSIQLAYKMAGYTDQSFIQVIAEQSSPKSTNTGVVIPNESYAIELNKSTPTNSLTYSAVVVERTSTGYSVSGYDNTAPYFTIIPSLVNGNTYQIPVLNDTAVIYQDFQKYKVTVPYGYEFTTRQQVVDFLVSYQRYLKGIGFTFTDSDPDLGTQRDWILSVKEFLTWAQQGWAASSVIVLSPVLDHISLYTATGVVDKIQNTPSGSCVLDTSYNFIKYSQLSVNRSSSITGNLFEVTANSGQTIALVRLAVVEYEHVIIFDNVDIFNDVIYVPELGNRQYRLKLVGKKTGSWTGDVNPPGFIFNNTTVDAWQSGVDYLMGTLVTYKNINYTALQDIPASASFDTTKWAQLSNSQIQTGLLPNFSYNAEKFNRFNDVDNPEILGDFHLYSDSTIGFQPRQYLTDFGLDEVTQAKFYQGYIRQKGTMNAINAFNALGVNGATSNINVYEEWAFRVGEYGALNNNRSIDLILTEGTFNSDPVTITLLPTGGTVNSNSVIGIYPTELYKTQGTYTPTIYKNRDASSNYKNDVPTAGYVDISDIDLTVYDLTNVSTLNENIDKINIGAKIWAAKDTSGNWNVYRVNETDNNVLAANYNVDNIGTFTTQTQHGLGFGDLIVIKNFDVRVDGVYAVYNVVDAYNFSVVFQGQAATQLKSAMTISGVGSLFFLQSVRFTSPSDLNSIAPANGWQDNDKLWIDSDYQTNSWVVYNKSTPWTGNTSIFNANMKLNANSYVTNSGYGQVVAINNTGTFALASSQYLNGKGNVYAFVSNVSNGYTYTMVANIGAHSGNIRFGAALDTAGNIAYIGNPGSISSYGRVHIHNFDGITNFPWTQTLSSPFSSNTGDLFGSSVSASADGVWLYVGAPGAGNVYVYQANSTFYYSYANTISTSSSASSQFGYSLKSTSSGNQVVISAPYQSVNGVTNAGMVYVYDRSIENFYANGVTYTTSYPISSTSKITVNGNVVTTGYTASSKTLTFTTAPIIGSLITVETNYFQLLETLTSPTPTSGGLFGSALSITGNDADIFVSAPGYTTPGYHSGIVYRYVNQGASYGTITGTTFNGNVNLGDSIRINGVNVAFTAGNTITAANNINSANIVGVSAIAQGYGALTITSNVTTPYQHLIIGPGNGNAMANLGLNVFTEVQSLLYPTPHDISEFGIQIASSADSKTLVVTAVQGSTYNSVSFDADTTTFDVSSTMFFDTVVGSGSAFVYGLVDQNLTYYAKDQYVLIGTLQNNSLSSNDQFGTSVTMNANTMLIGAPGDSNSTTFDNVTGIITPIQGAGTFYIYNNFSGNVGWDAVKQQTAQVDIDSISRLYLYNANTQVILTDLDWIDPAKGKVLGAAAEDLDFITSYDPAVYNAVSGIDSIPTNIAYSIDHYWGADHTTKTWWNTDAVRYLNYEQGNVEYRANNWGATFPGSEIQVCEWVASSVPPSAYTGSGTALYPDNSAYSVVTTINPHTKLSTSTYYFWVTGKTSLEEESVHLNTISTIQDLIANPQSQNIPYATVVRDDTISIHGISTYLTGNSTVLHADYDVLRNTNVIHSEYKLVQENNPNSKVPDRIVNKLIDSLCGADANGFAVPDSSLSPQSSIGLGIAPNQTLIVDRLTALENWVEYVNSILIQYPVVKEFNINPLYESQALPNYATYDIKVANYVELGYVETTNISSGYTVLVTADETKNGIWTTYQWDGTAWVLASTQSYYTPLYWSFADWYESTYDNTVLPTYVVQSPTDVPKLTLVVGDTVKILNNGDGKFVIYQVNTDGTTSLVGIQGGTIQLNSTLYTTNLASQEIRVIFNALENYIFIDTLSIYFNQMCFFLINYILTEQPTVDWVFKTSFIGILHYYKTLGQSAAYVPDDQTYYENYINEVKPYRTSIREYLLQYQGNDEYYGDSTDFDIPSTYITSKGEYYSPFISNVSNASDSNWSLLSTLPQYSMWNNNHSYSIGSVIVANVGANYTMAPTVTVVGGGGTGANIQAIINPSTGQLSGFNVIDAGYGYTSQPQILINGTGVNGTGYAKLVNKYQIESIPTVQLVTNVAVTVTAGNIISQANNTAYGIVYSTSTGNVVTLVDVVGSFDTVNYLFNDFSNLMTNATSISSFTQFENTSYNTVRNFSTTLVFDRTTYSSNIIAWQPNSTVAANTIVSFDGVSYIANTNVYSSAILALNGNISTLKGTYITQAGTTANAVVTANVINGNTVTVANLTTNFIRRGGNILVNGVDTGTSPLSISNIFDYTKYQLVPASTYTNAADRVLAYYDPTSGMPGKDLAQVMSGIEYPGINVDGVTYSANTSVFTSNLVYTWSNSTSMFSSNLLIPALSLVLSSSSVVYTNQTVTQPSTGASGIVYQTSATNSVILTNISGTFATTGSSWISADGVNLSVKTATTSAFDIDTGENKVDFTTLNYTSGEPIILKNLDTGYHYNLIITEIATNEIIFSGNVPTTSLGSNLSLVYYDVNNPTYLDTSITNTYTASNAHVTLDGGAYYDTYSSHAPEEFVPGVTFDNLNMSVYTGMVGLSEGVGFPNPPSTPSVTYTANVGYRIVQNMNGNIASSNYLNWPIYYGLSASHVTRLTANLNITDTVIHVADASRLTSPNFVTNTPGTVFINGEKIIFWGIDTYNNTLSQIRRAVDGTGAPTVHAIGSELVDTSINQLIPGGNVVSKTTWLNGNVGGAKQFEFSDSGYNQYDWVDANGNNVITSATVGAVTDGTGLQGSNSAQALFLKQLT